MRLVVYVLLVAGFSACWASFKPIYNDVEKAKADRMVAQFHELYNESRFEEMYALLDDSMRATVNKEQHMASLKQVYEKWGKVRDSRVSEARVFPGNPIQIRAIYNTQFEKGQGQEWFTCNIHGEEARLMNYTNGEGFDKPNQNKTP